MAQTRTNQSTPDLTPATAQGVPDPQGPQCMPGIPDAQDAAGPAGLQGLPRPQDDSSLVASLMNQGQCGVSTYASAFVMRDGSVRIGGAASSGSPGLGDHQPAVAPVVLASGGAAMAPARSVHLCHDGAHILTQDGEVWGWGYDHGRGSDGATSQQRHPRRICFALTRSRILKLVSTRNGSAGSSAPDMGPLTPVRYFVESYVEPRSNRALTRSLGLRTGQVWVRSSSRSAVEVLDESEAKGAGGLDSSLAWYALDDQGKVWSWGYNGSGRSALEDGAPRSAPVTMGLSNVVELEAGGGSHGSVHAITANGEAWATGHSAYGQTGLGISNQNLWRRVNLPGPCVKICATGSPSTGGNSGVGHTLWLLGDGRVFAAGYNGHGQIGNNSTAHVTGDPVAVPGLSDIVNIWAVGGHHGSSFASRADGTLFGWGNNNHGQLGLGHMIARLTPVQNPLDNIVALAGASNDNHTHTVLLDSYGRAYAAGYNRYGQCGVGTTGIVLSHQLMALAPGVQGTLIQVGTMGHSSTTGTQLLDARGRVWSCGYNGGAMLGIGERKPAYLTTPTRAHF